ncbi:MAG: Ser-Thr-rich GPI-anchored membrane family protein [Bacteroidota bacterium]
MRSIFTGALLLLFSSPVWAQAVSVTKVELSGNKVIVYYELDDNNPNNEYLMSLYASKDNFATPLTKVKGDVGPEVKPGAGKKIEWAITEEYGEYVGKLALEVRGKVYVPVVKLQNFDAAKVYKRGKSYDLTWKAGGNNPINIELYKGGQRIEGTVNHPNNGAYTLFIPAHAKRGDDYRLKISDAKNSEDIVYSNFFRVRPKVSMLLKAGLPLVLIGGIIAILPKSSGGDDPGGNGNGNTGSDIETPSLPGG